MRILITGALGLCGTHLIDLLNDTEEVSKIFGVDDFSRGFPRKEGFVMPGSWEDKVELIIKRYQHISIKEINNLDVDAVVHLAAYNSVGESMETPMEYFINNDYGTLNLLEKLNHTKNTPFFLFASTAALYGRPLNEPVFEDSTPRALNVYMATKLAAEQYCSSFFNWHKYPLAIARFSKVYGENQNPVGYSSVISNFICQALREDPLIIYGCGNQLRDFIYAGDAARAIVKILKNQQKVGGQVINIASGELVSVEAMANKVIKLTGGHSDIIKLPVKKGDYSSLRIGNDKAVRLLDWSAGTSLEQGLVKTIEWHKSIQELTI